MDNERHLKDGTAAFYIYDDKLSHDSDNEFLLWLKEKGFKSEGFGHQNVEHAMYVNINAKVFNWGMAGVSLATVVGNHAIHIDEFKSIYAIFEKYEGLNIGCYTKEDSDALDAWIAGSEERKLQAQRVKDEYFSKNPTFEQWCNDIMESIAADEKMSRVFNRERVLEDMEYPSIKRDLLWHFQNKEMPEYIAGQWDIVTF